MEMCPYCGEEVPDDSTTCWKCGTELGGEKGGGGANAIEQRGSSAQKQGKRQCPFCHAAISAKALRCNECGRPLTKVARSRNWGPAVWLAFLVVVVGLVGGVVYAIANRPDGPDPGRDNPIGEDYGDLARIYLGGGGDQPRRRQMFEERHRHRFVRWQGVIVTDYDPATGDVGLALRGDAERPQVIVNMKASQPNLQGLRRGKQIQYSARLTDFERDHLRMDLGLVEAQ